MPEQGSQAEWPEAIATVTSCTYSARAGRAIAFGLPSSKHFRIAYQYWADGDFQTGELFSEKPIPQGSLFPIRYDPEAPHRSSGAHETESPRTRYALLWVVGLTALLVGLWIVLSSVRF